jgi:hypothetical protein
MSLQNNKISGDIPPEIGKLTNLNALDLSSNEFVGDIPSSLGQLTRLNYLRLDRNNLSGQIPVDVAKLPGLTFLDLSFNNLSGPVPKIYAHDYSLAGNRFLCNSSIIHGCSDLTAMTNGSYFTRCPVFNMSILRNWNLTVNINGRDNV